MMKENKARDAGNDFALPLGGMAEATAKTYEQALRTGLKMQEEAGKWVSSVFSQAALAPDWQKRWTNLTALSGELMPLAQRRMEDMIGLWEKNGKTGAEVVKKAVEATQAPGVAESQAKWMEVWTTSLGAVRCNAEAVSEFGAKAMDGWIDFLRKHSDHARAA